MRSSPRVPPTGAARCVLSASGRISAARPAPAPAASASAPAPTGSRPAPPSRAPPCGRESPQQPRSKRTPVPPPAPPLAGPAPRQRLGSSAAHPPASAAGTPIRSAETPSPAHAPAVARPARDPPGTRTGPPSTPGTPPSRAGGIASTTAPGYSARNRSTSASSLSPNCRKQSPRSVAPSTASPSAVSKLAHEIAIPAPPPRNSIGVIPIRPPTRSYNRLLDPYPASKIASVTAPLPPWSERLNRFMRSPSTYCFGLTPTTARNLRCRVRRAQPYPGCPGRPVAAARPDARGCLLRSSGTAVAPSRPQARRRPRRAGSACTHAARLPGPAPPSRKSRRSAAAANVTRIPACSTRPSTSRHTESALPANDPAPAPPPTAARPAQPPPQTQTQPQTQTSAPVAAPAHVVLASVVLSRVAALSGGRPGTCGGTPSVGSDLSMESLLPRRSSRLFGRSSSGATRKVAFAAVMAPP